MAACIGGMCWRGIQGCFCADKGTGSFSCFPSLQKISQVYSSLLHKLLSCLRSYQRNKSFQQRKDAKHRNAIKVAKRRCRAGRFTHLELYSMSSSDSKPSGILLVFLAMCCKRDFVITHLQQRKFCRIDKGAWEGGKKERSGCK